MTPVNDAANEFVPTANQWRMETVSLSPYASATNAMIKFSNHSQYGDQMYLDDINITGVTGISTNDLASFVSVFPNPSNGMVYVNTSLPSSENVEIHIYDVLGRTIALVKQNDVTNTSFTFDLSDKTNGVYFVEIRTEEHFVTKKLVLNK
jgi:hypothetical protein